MKDGIDDFYKKSTGLDKQISGIVRDHFKESQASQKAWGEIFNAVQAPRIMNYSILNNDTEFEYQRNIIILCVYDFYELERKKHGKSNESFDQKSGIGSNFNVCFWQ